MKRIHFAAVLMTLILAISGCGGGGGGSSTPSSVVSQVTSRPALDGDIQLDLFNFFTVTQGYPQSVFAGINPVTGSEFRAFLLFPLEGVVPASAYIESAKLTIFIDSITIDPLAGSIPIRIELVSFPQQTLQPLDFDRNAQPPLAFTTVIPPVSRADLLRHVSIDVTSLMVEAQRRGLTNFQIRILEDDGYVFEGLIGINDTNTQAPLLEVTYH